MNKAKRIERQKRALRYLEQALINPVTEFQKSEQGKEIMRTEIQTLKGRLGHVTN